MDKTKWIAALVLIAALALGLYAITPNTTTTPPVGTPTPTPEPTPNETPSPTPVPPTPTQTPVVTPTPSSTPVANPTPTPATPSPSVTPRPPTPTPTATPAPSQTPAPSPSATPTQASIPAPLMPQTGAWPAMPGCPTPSASSASRTWYVDAVNGSDTGDGSLGKPWKSLQYLFDKGLIQSEDIKERPYDYSKPRLVKNPAAPIKPGDTILVRSGSYGDLNITAYRNPEFITIKADIGASPIFGALRTMGAERFVFQGLHFSKMSTGYSALMQLENHGFQGPSQYIFAVENEIYSTKDVAAWTVADWVDLGKAAWTGITSAGKCNTLLRNKIYNVRYGIQVTGNDTVVMENTIDNFSGDGIRPNASRVYVGKNRVTNVLVDDAAGDGNHDDLLQIFNLTAIPLEDITIDSNVFIDSTDPKRPFQSGAQGIGHFNGSIDRLNIMNNLVIASAYHGIASGGLRDSRIINNTVFGSSIVWINCNQCNNTLIQNNLANKINTPVGTAVMKNNIITTKPQDYLMKFDYALKQYDAHLKEGSAAKAKGLSDVSVKVDIEGKTRGNPPSVGAYE